MKDVDYEKRSSAIGLDVLQMRAGERVVFGVRKADLNNDWRLNRVVCVNCRLVRVRVDGREFVANPPEVRSGVFALDTRMLAYVQNGVVTEFEAVTLEDGVVTATLFVDLMPRTIQERQ